MIRVTQRYFDSILRSINDTSRQIIDNPNGSFVDQYRSHINALRALMLEIEVVDYMTGAEAMIENEKIFNRIAFSKTRKESSK